jgi:fructose/tagatose bisphosphate aldolase
MAGRHVIMVRDWRQTEAALQAARKDKTSPILVTPENAAATYGAGYLAALQERARREFPDVDFTLIVDCGDTPGYALACLRAGVRHISMNEPNDKIADIARQMGAELVRRPS